MLTTPGAAMLDLKLFVSRLDGPFRDLYERWWDGDEWFLGRTLAEVGHGKR